MLLRIGIKVRQIPVAVVVVGGNVDFKVMCLKWVELVSLRGFTREDLRFSNPV
jgi:hypothetical protein